jgi:hypothetical protein
MVGVPESPKEGVMLLALLFAGAMVAGFTVVGLYGAVAGGTISAVQATLVVGVTAAALVLGWEVVKRR